MGLDTLPASRSALRGLVGTALLALLVYQGPASAARKLAAMTFPEPRIVR